MSVETAPTVPAPVRRFARLWPRSLAGRLVVLLVAALAVVQYAFAWVVWGQQDRMVAEVARGQALSQAVALARLVQSRPAAEAAGLADAFGSRMACARVFAPDEAPPAGAVASSEAPTRTETELALALSAMLHGVRAGAVMVAIDPVDDDGHPCEALGLPAREPPRAAGASRDGPGAAVSRSEGRRGRVAAVAMTVPLADGRVLAMRTAVAVPGRWSRVTFLSFVLSALAAAGVVVVAVSLQTRSLRSLAAASDRLGRGETPPPLDPRGPSEVAAAIEAFNTMQARLGRFLEDRLKLLAGISHDLRTPLTTLRLKAEFVEDEDLREDIVRTIEELAAICEATLAFTRAEATTEETRAVDLVELAAAVADPMREAGADVTVAAPGGPVPFACRPVALRRALRNLVDNAVRYGGVARVTVTAEGDAAVLTVADDGPGLPADRIEDAFQPFVRLEPSRNSETGGIGLGLAIARSIVRAHGGTLTLANRAGGGLVATMRLPGPAKA